MSAPPDEESAPTELAETRDEGTLEAPTPPWVRELVRLLDDWVRIPGTDQRVGIDALLGFLFPGAGDAVTALGSASLFLIALRRRVPTVVLIRMVIHVLVDLIIGSVPLVGDVFDAFFRANRRNLELIDRHAEVHRPARASDYLIVGIGLVVVAASVIVPIVLLLFLGGKAAGFLWGDG